VTGGESFKEGAQHDAQELSTVLESLKTHSASDDRPSSHAIIQDLDTATSQLESATNTALEADLAGLSSREVNERILAAYSQIAAVNLLHNELTEQTLLQVGERAVDRENTISSVITQFLVLTIAVVLSGIIIAVVLSSYLSRPIQKLKKSADEIARGNLDVQIETTSRDEIGELAQAFNTMASSLGTELAERTKAEGVLRESEDRFRSFTENAPDFVMQIGRDGTIQFINRTHEGLIQEDVVGSSVLSWLPGDHAPAFEHALAQVFETAQAQVVEHPAWNQHGETSWYSSHLGPIGERGGVTSAIVVARDITDRKQAEEALEESEERHRLLVEHSNQAIIVVQDLQIRFCNFRTVELTGYSGEELASKKFIDFMHPDDKQMVIEYHLKRYEGEEVPDSLQYRFIDRYGNTKWVESNAVIIDWGSRPATLGFISDITERKKAEEALKEYSERLEAMVEERTEELRETQQQLILKEKLATLGRLAGGVAHELRNPLGAIKNAAYYLNMVLKKPKPEVRESLDIMNKEIATSERIISSLFDVASPKERVRQRVDLNDVIRTALSRAGVPGTVEVITQLDETLPAVPADPDQLGQVFGNIILNAAQAMPDGGHLTIKSESLATGQVAVSVSDTGVGMADDTTANIFEPLFTTKAKGMGLGLALAKSIIEAHHGTIRAQSKPGEGTTFTVELPIISPDEATGQEAGPIQVEQS
jgi:PAS domain S-box-containing protein